MVWNESSISTGKRSGYDIMFPLTPRSHSHCPCWGTQTPGPHPGAGCAWVPPPAGLTGHPGSDQLHTMRSQSKSPSGTKPSHRALGQITSPQRSIFLLIRLTDWLDSFPLQYLNQYRRNIYTTLFSELHWLSFINSEWKALAIALLCSLCFETLLLTEHLMPT